MPTTNQPPQWLKILKIPWQEFWTRVRSIPREDILAARAFALWTAVCLFVLYACFWGIAKYSASGTADSKLETFIIPASSPATNLIVVVHHYQSDTNGMTDVFTAIREVRQNSDIMAVQYQAATFSNADCFQLADQLCQKVNEHWSSNKYKEVEFVGYSMGALLVRKAYVYGWGRIEDLKSNPGALPATRPVQAWATNTTRFVLLAGMNRGWTTRTRPDGMGVGKWALYKFAQLVAYSTGTGQMIKQVEAGHPFVANLRMQWLDVYREQRATGKHPLVLQLLGDADDLVTREDERDISVSKDFVWVQLSGTAHRNAANFVGEQSFLGTLMMSEEKEKLARSYADQRKLKFQTALGDTNDISALRRMSPQVPSAEDTNVVAGVVVLHGIRDRGTEWTSQFEDALQARFLANRSNNQEKLVVYRPTYGYFDMISFLLRPRRQEKVRWFMDELTELQAKYPNMTNMYFIGHSHGTYVLASALEQYKALKLERVAFAGSVVPRSYDWATPAMANRIQRVRNFQGSGDILVATFPRLYELLKSDLGSAGFNGFEPRTNFPVSWETFMKQTTIIGGHSTAIEAGDTNMIDSIAAFVMNNDPVEPAAIKIAAKGPGGVGKFLTHRWVCPVVWVILLLVLGVVGIYVTWGIRKLLPYFARFGFGVRQRPLIFGLLAWIIYIGFLLQLLTRI